MNLSQYENEDAIDLLADMLEPITWIVSDPKFKKQWESGEPIVKAIVYALREHKQDVINLVAAMHREDPKEYKFTLASLMADLMDLVKNPTFQMVFPVQGRSVGSSASGSATESTEEKET